MAARTFQLISFGCKVNQAEGESLVRRLLEAGLEEAPADRPADLVILNTCAVTAEAARQCRQGIRRAVRAGAAVVVTGCGAHPAARDAAMAGIPGVLFLEPDKGRVAARLTAPSAPRQYTGGEQAPGAARSRALLKVQDGCPAACAYCIVPKVRPTLRSMPPEDAARRVGELAAAGFREIVLCGIRLGLYGADLGPRVGLADLLERLLAVPGLGRLRLSSLEPMEVNDRLLALLAAEPDRLCPHLHLPLQSGDDEVLRRMGRPYTSADYLAVAARVRRALDCPAVTTDVLVGFPGETDAAFAATLRVSREAGFSRIHVFPFSGRPGTAAAGMQPQVPPNVIRARRAEAGALGKALAAAYRAGLVGRTAEVIVEAVAPDGSADGLSERYVRVRIRGPLPAGVRRRDLVAVRLVAAADGFLAAEAGVD